jgi:hypothetical protein
MNLLTKFGFIMLLVIDQMSRAPFTWVSLRQSVLQPRLPEIAYEVFFKNILKWKIKNILQNGGPQICQ